MYSYDGRFVAVIMYRIMYYIPILTENSANIGRKASHSCMSLSYSFGMSAK